MNASTYVCPPEGAIVAALGMWSNWSLDVPPTDVSGDKAVDERLAVAFRSLAALGDAEARMRWLEHVIFANGPHLSVVEPVDRYRDTLIRWWLAIYDDQVAPAIDRRCGWVPPAVVCDGCGGARVVFECPHWPSCDCPGGTTREGCPGKTVACTKCQ